VLVYVKREAASDEEGLVYSLPLLRATHNNLICTLVVARELESDLAQQKTDSLENLRDSFTIQMKAFVEEHQMLHHLDYRWDILAFHLDWIIWQIVLLIERSAHGENEDTLS
jgi:hypothetical protein